MQVLLNLRIFHVQYFNNRLRPKDLDASIEIFTDKQIINLHGLCCNKVNISFGGNQSLNKRWFQKIFD